MEKREIDLTVSCYGKVKDVKYDVVILPWGATEPHNPVSYTHLTLPTNSRV